MAQSPIADPGASWSKGKDSAKAAIRKAIKAGEVKAEDYEVRPVEGGFQIFYIKPAPEAPKPARSWNATEYAADQNGMPIDEPKRAEVADAKVFGGKPAAEVWIPFMSA